MPGVVPTLGNDGPIPAPWSAVAQALNKASAQGQATALQTNGQILDQYQNTCAITGNLNQTVTVGAGWISGAAVGGVQVATGLTGFGIAYPTAFAHTTVTTTKGSTSATVASPTGLVNGMECGAADSSGNQVISAGTTFTISGSTLTLSQQATETGSFYFCACAWAQLGIAVHP